MYDLEMDLKYAAQFRQDYDPKFDVENHLPNGPLQSNASIFRQFDRVNQIRRIEIER